MLIRSHMQLTGRYGTIIDFLRQRGALKLKRVVTISRMSLSLSNDVEPGQSPTLSVSMPMNAQSKGLEIQLIARDFRSRLRTINIPTGRSKREIADIISAAQFIQGKVYSRR